MTTGAGGVCPVDVDRPQVVVAVAHRAMRALIVDLLKRDHGCWTVSAIDGVAGLSAAVTSQPDVVVVDAADFGCCCGGRLGGFQLDRIVVIGPEPDPAYRKAVLDRGAGAWLSREHVAEELAAALRLALGCSHGRGPPRPQEAPGEAIAPVPGTERRPTIGNRAASTATAEETRTSTGGGGPPTTCRSGRSALLDNPH